MCLADVRSFSVCVMNFILVAVHSHYRQLCYKKYRVKTSRYKRRTFINILDH